MREKMNRFMSGRYGADELSKALSIGVLVCFVLSMIGAKIPFFFLFYWFGIGLMIYECYRMFSRNISKRYAENQKFLNARYQMAVKKDRWKKHWAQRKNYRFFKCPDCRQKVRVPKGRGKICITCPKCKREFVKRS
jgi:predicted membrane protein